MIEGNCCCCCCCGGGDSCCECKLKSVVKGRDIDDFNIDNNDCCDDDDDDDDLFDENVEEDNIDGCNDEDIVIGEVSLVNDFFFVIESIRGCNL